MTLEQIERDLAQFAALSAWAKFVVREGYGRRITVNGQLLTNLLSDGTLRSDGALRQAVAKIAPWKADELITLGLFQPSRGRASIHRCEPIDPETGDLPCTICHALLHDEVIAGLRAERGRWMTVDDEDGIAHRHRSLQAARREVQQCASVGIRVRVLRYRRARAPIVDAREERIAAPRWRP